MMLEGTIDVEVAQEHIDAWAKGREGEYTALVPPPHTLTARDHSPSDLDLNDAGKEKQNIIDIYRAGSGYYGKHIDLCSSDSKEKKRSSRCIYDELNEINRMFGECWRWTLKVDKQLCMEVCECKEH